MEMNLEQLAILLVWHTMESSAMLGKTPERVSKWKDIIDDNSSPPVLAKWMPQDDAKLHRWKKKDIEIGYTMCGRLVVKKKRELDAAQDHHTSEMPSD